MKRWISFLAVLCVMLAVTACSSDKGKTNPDASSTVETAPPLLSVDLSKLLTTEQIADAIGTAVGEPQMYEDKTWAHYTGTDSPNTTVDISLDENTREVFDARAALYANHTAVPQLGEVSWWDKTSGELLTYGNGYIVSVRVGFADQADEDMQQMATRHLTALLLDALA